MIGFRDFQLAGAPPLRIPSFALHLLLEIQMTHDIIKQIPDGRTDLGLDFAVPAARLDRHFGSSSLDQYSPHGLGSRLKEAPAAVPVPDFVYIDEPDISVMDHRGGVQRLPRLLLASVAAANVRRSPIHQRQQLPCRRRIAGLDLRQDAGDVGHRENSGAGKTAPIIRSPRPLWIRKVQSRHPIGISSQRSTPSQRLPRISVLSVRSAANRNIPSYTGEFLRIPKLSKTLLISR